MKLNLHSHLEGRLRPATAAALAKEQAFPPPSGGWEESLQLDGPSNLTVYLSKVSATYPFFRSPKHVSRIACEAVEDAAADGTNYLELRFGPATHVHMGFAMDSVIAAACDSMAESSAAQESMRDWLSPCCVPTMRPRTSASRRGPVASRERVSSDSIWRAMNLSTGIFRNIRGRLRSRAPQDSD